MAILNSKFDILRGWPDGSAIAEDFKISKLGADAAAGDDIFRTGRFVRLGVDAAGVGAAYTCGADASATNSDGSALGLIIEGEEDYSSLMSKTVTCLIAGGYVVKLHNESSQAGFQQVVAGGEDMFRATSTVGGAVALAAGAQVAVFNGLVEAFDNNAGANTTQKAIGTCLRYDATDHTCDILVY
jgi:cold shock CspA family protein